MTERIGKTQRWLDLVVFLLRHRLPVTVEQIMEAVPGYAGDWASEDETRRGNVRRNFERDKDELRGLGIPIETLPYTVEGQPQEGYRLKEGEFYLPRLVIKGHGSAEETPTDERDEPDRARRRIAGLRTVTAPAERWSALARAAYRVARLPDSPLAPYGRSALRKLGFDLPELEDAADEPGVYFLDLPDPAVAAALEILTPALLARKEVRFEYYSIGRDERGPRRAWPYGLLYQGGVWYLIARDPEAEGIRTFRASRMSGVEMNERSPKTPDYEIPRGFDLRDYVGREAWRLGENEADEIVAEVLFLPPTSWWAEAQELGEYVRADETSGGQVRAFRVRQLDPFLRWCLTFRGQARPLGPEPVVAGFRDLVERVAALYAEDTDAD